jgi:2-dehydropantoate 2-reductase
MELAAARVSVEDVVTLAVKSEDTNDAIASLAVAGTPDIPVVCAQNGVETSVLHFNQVFGCLVFVPSARTRPGIVSYATSPITGMMDVGLIPSGRDALAAKIARGLRDAGFASDVVDDSLGWKHHKFITTSPMSRQCCSRPVQQRNDPLIWREMRRVLASLRPE